MRHLCTITLLSDAHTYLHAHTHTQLQPHLYKSTPHKTHTYIHSFHETQFTYLHGQYIYRVYINVYTHKYLKLYIFTRIKNINMHVFETVGLSDTLIAITEQHDKKNCKHLHTCIHTCALTYKQVPHIKHIRTHIFIHTHAY